MALFLKRYKKGGNGGGAEPFGRTMHRTPEEQEIQKKNRATAAAEHEKRRNLLIMKLFYLLPYDGEKDFTSSLKADADGGAEFAINPC